MFTANYLENSATTDMSIYIENTLDVSGTATFDGTAIFNKRTEQNSTAVMFGISEKFSDIGTTNAIDFSLHGSNVYSGNTQVGPHSYSITNVSDLSSNSHTFTILSRATQTNYESVYINSLNVEGNQYTIHWGSGEDPGWLVHIRLPGRVECSRHQPTLFQDWCGQCRSGRNACAAPFPPGA